MLSRKLEILAKTGTEIEMLSPSQYFQFQCPLRKAYYIDPKKTNSSESISYLEYKRRNDWKFVSVGAQVITLRK